MARIYRYQKIIDSYTTHCLVEPDYELLETDDRITELCELDGWTYVSVPDSIKLPEQPVIIKVLPVDLTKEPETKKKILESDIFRNTNKRVVDKIRERYDLNEEIKLLRTALAATIDPDYNAYVEGCRTWGDEEKKKLVDGTSSK